MVTEECVATQVMSWNVETQTGLCQCVSEAAKGQREPVYPRRLQHNYGCDFLSLRIVSVWMLLAARTNTDSNQSTNNEICNLCFRKYSNTQDFMFF